VADTNFFGGPFFGESVAASRTHFFSGPFFDGDYFGDGGAPVIVGGFFRDDGTPDTAADEYIIRARRRHRR
jgi:hypothetical protein